MNNSKSANSPDSNSDPDIVIGTTVGNETEDADE